MVEFGSKEHTQAAYKFYREDVEKDTGKIIEFLQWLKSENRLEQLIDMEGLTIFEKGLIDSILNK